MVPLPFSPKQSPCLISSDQIYFGSSAAAVVPQIENTFSLPLSLSPLFHILHDNSVGRKGGLFFAVGKGVKGRRKGEKKKSDGYGRRVQRKTERED